MSPIRDFEVIHAIAESEEINTHSTEGVDLPELPVLLDRVSEASQS